MNKVAPEVMTVLEKCTCKDGMLFLPPEKLERDLYVKVNKCLESLGGKWNRKAGGHTFGADDAARLLDGVLMTGEYTNWKQAFQFFVTPPELSKRLVQMADLQDKMRVLEPSAGDGSIVNAIVSSGISANIDVCELDKKHHDTLKKKARVVGEDFTKFSSGPIYDRVIANPPFTRQQDIEHVTRMVECCKPGGKVVSIMSSGVTFRTDKKTTQFKEKFGSRMSIEALPEGSFKTSGTMVNAVIVVIKV